MSNPATGRMSTAAAFAISIVGGLFAQLIWELWARFAAPVWLGARIDQTVIVKVVFGTDPLTSTIIHLAVGIVVYPLFYTFVARPIVREIDIPWLIGALAYGVVIWVFALYVMAYVFAGFPPFLDFRPEAWGSLVGHLLYALVLGAAVAIRDSD